MRVAVIAGKISRMPLGEIFTRILNSYNTIEATHFDLTEIQEVKGGFDLYLRLGDDNYEEIPSFLHPVAWWVNDTHLKKSYRKIKRMVKNYDFIFCAQKEGALKLYKETGKKTFWIPWACDEPPADFKFVEDREKVWDICFIGTSGKYSLRKVVLEVLRINYKNIFIGRADYRELRDYYSKARIVVNYPINNDINARIFEAMSSGSLVITCRIKNNGFSEIFEEGENIVVFEDILKDMKQKIDYYLQNKEERERITLKGFELVNRYHTYRHRLKEMFKIMGYDLESLK
ncbi:MAG: glycosyltransferase [Candidatus Omnitrophota bacterium]